MRTFELLFLSSCIRFLYEFINCVCGSWIRDTFNRWNDYTITSPYNFDFSSEYFLPIKQVGANYHATLDGQIAMEQIEEILQQQKEYKRKI